jgi:predicted Zn finger-like uncharacterized protein
MHIDCPGCGKSYHIRTAELGPEGRRVACPRCDAIWFVAADGTPAAAESSADDTQAHDAVDEIIMPPTALSPQRAVAAPNQSVSGQRRIPSIVAAGALIAVSMAFIGFRTEIVQAVPRTATVYASLGLPVNLRGLALENFHAVALGDGRRTVLGIEGEIKNLRGRTTDVPALHLAIRGADGRILYSWVVTAQKARLGANETASFRARLAAPPAEGQSVFVDFVPARQTGLAALWRKATRL